jgi:sulfur relay (sulfurtransferase) DsrF/TusC family protein
MKPRVLFIVTADPRSSARTAEAVRIAAGVKAWQKSDVVVYLRDAAVLALGESPGRLIAEEDYARYWPIVAESGQPVYVQKNAKALAEVGQSAVPFKEISDEQLAELAAKQTYVIRF